jgi:hypothetical protein
VPVLSNNQAGEAEIALIRIFLSGPQIAVACFIEVKGDIVSKGERTVPWPKSLKSKDFRETARALECNESVPSS